MLRNKWSFIFSLILSSTVLAKDFGHMGEVFCIEEESLMTILKRRMSDPSFPKDNGELLLRLSEKAESPTPVKDLKKASQYHSFHIDPSIRVESDIHDAHGKVIVRQGTLYNPLKTIHLSSGLLFFDGDDENQLGWAKQQVGNYKWILTNGKPIELEEKERRPIYFDQDGTYISRFQIKNLPAKVVQQNSLLLVEEISLKQNKATEP